MDYRARFRAASPLLNRFIQPDTIVPGMYNPQMLNRFSYVGNNPINFNDPSGHLNLKTTNLCTAEGWCGDTGTGMNNSSSSTSGGGNNWGISDEDMAQLNTAIENGEVKAGDVVAYDLLGTSSYAMFAIDPSTNEMVLWDMTTKRQISLSEIQGVFMALYLYEEKRGNFNINSLVGNSSDAAEELGSTIGFQNFPSGWAGGSENHIGFYSQSEINCGIVCTGIATYSAGQLVWEMAKLAARSTFTSAKISAGNPAFWIGISVTLFVVDMALNIENTGPIVVFMPGPNPVPNQMPTFGLPSVP